MIPHIKKYIFFRFNQCNTFLSLVLNLKTACKVAKTGITLFFLNELLNRCATYDQLFNVFRDCVLPANTQLIDVREGCV